ncbi:hypothetical protein ND861_08200 [Leptospira sp. 2 VSF19]|uniref:DUF3999 family protein n=1 Tax=Leptospira soteropolitanensis TaxID=2950025 RepID=A0AAW5VKE2_9LEPT|nr:hypothetical protein [Leptospira soteropolitanensis]MCW7492976.1 hypothetical protein [Leptospira soteropolitanensis]MCW7500211.1 hypothetical protein [Leptospira soteropolitanensis]MCW7522462.1 hypothetical protein [Leptospira soteropolitanensis]MCW7526318.1 hypothetical protein [Leptospira soteropolitanensis]MCW7529570.1 hypothetical protein [Leptospira soteropolitanensis]
MKFKYLLPILLFFTITTQVTSRPLAIQNFKYKKELKISNNLSPNGVVKLMLDEDIYKHSYYGDLRLTYNGEIIPYHIQNAEEISKNTEKVKPELLFSKKDDLEIYVLELPKLPEGMNYTKLSVSSAYDYETSITLKLGDNPNQFTDSKSVFLYKYGNQTSGEIDLGNTKHRFVRLEAEPGSDLKFPSAFRAKQNKNLYYEKTHTVTDPVLTEDHCQFLFPNEPKSAFQILKLHFEEDNWERKVTVRGKINKKEWETVFDGTVTHNKSDGTYTEIPLSQTITSEFEIQIYDGENETLHLKEVISVQPLEEIYFYANADGSKDGYALYYGNSYQWPPSFDPYSYPSGEETKTPEVKMGTLLAESENPDFSFSILYPPISGYLATGFFYLGVLALLYLLFSILKNKRAVLTESES